jgi:DNA polymerase-3 subunit gamma/tau
MVGQEHVTATLRHAIERDRIHHAYLFCGARGVGKTTAARALARSLNCERGPTADPCGVCPSCRDILAGTSPDLIEIDGASNTSVDDVRELRESVRYRPTNGKWKIYLVDEVHMLSNAAFNALLKTLEEPPSHVMFIFATTEPEKLPETILSRVQRFDFKRIGAQGVVDRLRSIATAEGVVVSDGALRLLARAGEGSMRDAQSLLDKVLAMGLPTVDAAVVSEMLGLVDRALLYDMVEGMVKGDPGKCLDVVAHVYDYGFELSRFVGELLETVRNATFLRLSEGVRKHVDLPEDEIARLLEITADAPPEMLTRLFATLVEVHDQVARASRPRAVLEMAVARLATVRPVQPLAALVTRLEQLERRLRQGGAAPSSPGTPPLRTSGPQGRSSRAPEPRREPVRPAARSRPLPQVAVAATDEARWEAFVAALAQCDPPVEGLPDGVPRREGATLVVTIAGGRRMALAKRALDRPELSELVEACYGTGASLRVEESLATRRPGLSKELEQLVLQDPACQRILHTLGATLLDVSPPTTEEPA